MNTSHLLEMDFIFTIEELKKIVDLEITKIEHKKPNSLIYTYVLDGKECTHRSNYFQMLHMLNKFKENEATL